MTERTPEEIAAAEYGRALATPPTSEAAAYIRSRLADRAARPADRAGLRQRIAEAARTVPLRLGPNAVAMAQRGEPIILNLNEADDLADAVLPVFEAALRSETGPKADSKAAAELVARTMRACAEHLRDRYSDTWTADAARSLDLNAARIERGESTALLRRLAGETQQDEAPSGTTPCGPAPSQCDAEAGEPCANHEREQAHAEGEHCFCGPECARGAQQDPAPGGETVPPAALGLPAGTLEAAEIGANRLDAWAHSPQGRNFLAHALVQLARTGWLRTEPGDGFEPMRDPADAPEPQDPTAPARSGQPDTNQEA